MGDRAETKIVVMKRGPYPANGNVPLSAQAIPPNSVGGSGDWAPGRSFEGEAEYVLRRCRASDNMPFCTGSRASSKFTDCPAPEMGR
jgi:CDGSH-type Zn-finger protein